MGARKSRSHLVTVRARFDTALSAKEARRAVWNVCEGLEMYGEYYDNFEEGKITVPGAGGRV